MLNGAAALGAAALTSALTAPAAAAAALAAQNNAVTGKGRTRVVLLGTAGGPMTWLAPHNGPDRARHGIATALVVGDRYYLVDCGMGVAHQLRLAELGRDGDFAGFEGLNSIFLTHLHSDHTMDYFNVLLAGWYHGLPGPEPVQVYGPGRRGSLPPIHGSGEVDVINPSNPTPGTTDMTEYLIQAYATDLNDRMRDSRKPHIRNLLHANDIALPKDVLADANHDTAPEMDPFIVMEDDRVRVSATLVDHGAVFPAFAFRFDTDDGSVVFSGDTAPSQNLIKMAQDTDVLIHEVIDADWVNALYGEPPYTPEEEGFIQHLLHSHTTIEQVGPVAEAAGAKTLVLSHLAPGNNPRDRWMKAQNGYTGKLIIGEDLMEINVP
ncbi:MBL fold metallo-hydrolase [Arthrobacter crystallopoietes]|nr:MBL fold metallo-hydrolase [Arthrobacter crystallopoietes]